MSGLINKIKDAVSGDHTTTSNTTSTTTHGVTDSHGNRQTGLDGTAGTHTAGHNTGYSSNTGMTGHNTSGVPEGTAGPHSSRVANAADPRVDSDLDRSRHTGTHGTHTGAGGLTGSSHNTYGSTNAGPHDSNIANKADPRVDSDRDGRAAYGSGVNNGSHGVGHHQQTVGAHGALPANTATGYSSTQSGPYSAGAPMHGSGTANNGPHDSKIANKLDPRVDSDRDGSRNMGAASNTGSGYNTGVTGSHGTHTGTTGSGLTGSSHTGSGPHQSSLANKADPRVDSSTGSHTIGSNTYTGPNTRSSGNTASGPHQSGVANTLDPRVDSTTGAHTVGSSTHTGPNTGTYGSSTHTGYGGSTNAGPHSSNMANKADPRVDSDRDGRSGLGSGHNAQTHATAGSGTAQNTAGPHNSDLLNKLDPRVDSDRDGSKTIGGDKTYADNTTSSTQPSYSTTHDTNHDTQTHHHKIRLPFFGGKGKSSTASASTSHDGNARTGARMSSADYTGKDMYDAAAVPPSIMKEAVGEPVLTHTDTHNNHAGRHGSVSEQERHKGL